MTAGPATTNHVGDHGGREHNQQGQRRERADLRRAVDEHRQPDTQLGGYDEPGERAEQAGGRAKLGSHLADAVAIRELGRAGDGKDDGKQEPGQQERHVHTLRR